MGKTLKRAFAGGDRSDDGFTLIEILVVIIIIGVLAAIAVPIYLNQQRTARDAATTTDVRGVIANVESARVTIPNPTDIQLNNMSTNDFYVLTVVGEGDKKVQIRGAKSKGTILNAYDLPNTDRYHVTGRNLAGLEYNGTGPGEAVLVYDSGVGRFYTHRY